MLAAIAALVVVTVLLLPFCSAIMDFFASSPPHTLCLLRVFFAPRSDSRLFLSRVAKVLLLLCPLSTTTPLSLLLLPPSPPPSQLVAAAVETFISSRCRSSGRFLASDAGIG